MLALGLTESVLGQMSSKLSEGKVSCYCNRRAWGKQKELSKTPFAHVQNIKKAAVVFGATQNDLKSFHLGEIC